MASSMMSTSRLLTWRIMRALSYLSLSWPLVAENSTKGKINSAPITSPAIEGGNQLTLSWYVSITVKANLNRLSLAAPEKSVQKKGAKRRWPSKAHWWLGTAAEGCGCFTPGSFRCWR